MLIGGFNIADSYFARSPKTAAGATSACWSKDRPRRACMPYYDALMDWSLAKRSRLKTLRAVVRQYSEHEGTAAVAVRRSDAAEVALGPRDPARPRRRPATSRW